MEPVLVNTGEQIMEILLIGLGVLVVAVVLLLVVFKSKKKKDDK